MTFFFNKTKQTMNDLNDDVLLEIISYLTPQDVISFYNSCCQFQTLLHLLSHHIGFVVECKEIVDNEIIKWFKQKNIKLQLLVLCDFFSFISEEKWYRNGVLHRDDDLPAIVTKYYQAWYCNGVLHRDGDLPAYIHVNGVLLKWYEHGKLHRDGDLPAYIHIDGEQMWYQHGKLHRDDDLPAHIDTNGYQSWYQNGLCHRDHDKPAVIAHHYQWWCQFDKFHRNGGRPALVTRYGHCQWYRYGHYQTKFQIRLIQFISLFYEI